MTRNPDRGEFSILVLGSVFSKPDQVVRWNPDNPDRRAQRFQAFSITPCGETTFPAILMILIRSRSIESISSSSLFLCGRTHEIHQDHQDRRRDQRGAPWLSL